MNTSLTTQGYEALRRVISGSGNLHFTKMQIGNGSNAGSSATALNSPKITMTIDSIREEEVWFIVLTGTFNNNTVTQGFHVTELGVWIEDPDDSSSEILYSYGYTPSSSADYVPPINDQVIETEVRLLVYVGDATNIDAEIPSGVYATKAEFNTHTSNTTVHITAAERTTWNNKVDKVAGKGLSTEDYTTAEKTKLAGIEAQANKYTHPSYTARTGKPAANLTPGFGGSVTVSQITSDASGHVTGATDRTITIPSAAATTSAAGLMSAADKTKLNGIAAGAQVNSITGVKGNAESSYRTGNVNLTPANIGAAAYSHSHAMSDVTGLVSAVTYGPTGLASFQGSEDFPLAGCVAEIEPVQAGSGDPSPSNVRAISGWTGVKVQRFGKNMLDVSGYYMNQYNYGITFTITKNSEGAVTKITANGTDTAPSSTYSQVYIQVPMAYAKRFAGKKLSGGYSADFYIQIEQNTSPYTIYAVDTGGGDVTIASGIAEAQYVSILFRVRRGATLSNASIYPMIRDANDDATFEPYRGQTIDVTFPTEAGTVYGGRLDVLSGLLTVDRGGVDLGALTWYHQQTGGRWYALVESAPSKSTAYAICDMYEWTTLGWTDLGEGQFCYGQNITGGGRCVGIKDSRYTSVSAFTAAVTGHKLVYELATPVTYQLTPQQIAAVAGSNHVWADCGDVTVEYGAFPGALQRELERHTHAATDITSGVLPTSRGGTGNSSGFVRAGQKSGTTMGLNATAEGKNTTASGTMSHAEGNATTASGNYSHAEGDNTTASESRAHVEGGYTTASGAYSHAEGQNTTASGARSHAEGRSTEASGDCAHAEGYLTKASGDYSHAQGDGTIAAGKWQHAFGKYNVEDPAAAIEASGYIEIVGNGVSSSRSNARTLDWGGNEWIAGTLTQASDARLKDVEGEIPDVSGIRAVRFKWNDAKGGHDELDHIGYLAQEVEEVAPFLVGDDSNGYKSLDYIALLCAKVEMLERKVAELEKS